MRIEKWSFVAALVAIGSLSCAATSRAGSSLDLTRNLHVISGREIKAFGRADLNPDCTNLGYSTIRALSGPSHGSIRMVHEKIYVNFNADNPRHKCSSSGGPGIQVYYKAAQGYHGGDQIVFSIYTIRGDKGTATINISVE